MIQLLIDHSDIHTLTALYVSIYFAMILKYLWAAGVEYSFIGSLAYKENTKLIHPLFFYRKKSNLQISLFLIRVVKYIRRKECPQDDSDEHISLLAV